MCGVKSIQLYSTGTAHYIATRYCAIIDQQLPTSVKPELQYIRCAVYSVRAAASLIPCANRSIIGSALRTVRLERNIYTGLVICPPVITYSCYGISTVPSATQPHNFRIQLLAQNIVVRTVRKIRFECTVAVMRIARHHTFRAAAGFYITLGASILPTCPDLHNGLIGVVKIIGIQDIVRCILNPPCGVGIKHDAVAFYR
ncbi:hypothetical protein D3C71_1194260 [compost metagenome]